MHVLLAMLAAASMNDPQIATVALTAHQIDVDRGTVPGAQNADLKTLLQNAIPTLEGHLQHAKMVQQQLGKSASR